MSNLPDPASCPLWSFAIDPETNKVYQRLETEATTWGGGPYMSEQWNNDGGKPYWFDTDKGDFVLRFQAKRFRKRVNKEVRDDG